jgi:hypothetical protein
MQEVYEQKQAFSLHISASAAKKGASLMHLHHRGLTRGQCTLVAVAAALFTLLVMTGVASAKGSDARLSSPGTQPNGQKCAHLFSVSPQAGPAGSKITISGTHWPANQQVGIFFVDASRTLRPFNLGAPGILPNGSWRLTIVVPSAVTFAPEAGDELINSDPITQHVTAGNYLLYASTGDDQHGFGIDQVCPQQFTVTTGPVSSTEQNAPASESSLWERLAVGVLLLLLLAIVLVVELRRWKQRRKVGVIGVGVVLLLILGGVMLAAGAFSVRATSASPAAGTVLLSDDFSGDTVGSVPTGWTQETGTSWSVQVDGTNALKQTSSSTSTLYSISAGSPTWTDYSISASVKPGPNSTIYGSSVVSINGRHTNVNNFYSLLVKNGNAWYLGKKVNGTFTTLASGSTSYNTTTWYTWVLSMTGSTISASINGTTLATVTDTAFSSGNISFSTRAQSEYDNVVVTSTGGSPTPTPAGTNTPAPTATNIPGPTATDTPAPTATETPTPTPTATDTPEPTATTTPTETPTSAPTATDTATPNPGGSGSITGQVTDSQGNPVAGAQVSTIPTTISTTTDGNGNYTLADIATGNYGVVVASINGFNATYVNATVTNGSTTVANETLNTPIPANTSMDTFFRPDEPEWNPASDGHTWFDDRSSYPGASTSISNNTGFVDTFTAATDRDEWMGGVYADQLVSADFEMLQYGQDNFQHGPRLLGRITDNHHFIDFAINYATSTLQIWSNKAEVWTMLAQVSVPRFVVNQWYHARLLTVGNNSFGKVWAFGTTEPGWMISGSQTGLTTGMGGIRTTFADAYWANFSIQGVTAITGRVTNSSGTAVANASVSDGTHSTTTDTSGRYVFIEPDQDATYSVTVTATGYTSQTVSVTVAYLKATMQSFTLT